MHAYCTYFDSGYLSRGLALIKSLREHGDHSDVWVLALDAPTKEYLNTLALPGVFALGIEDIEAVEPQLEPLKAARSRMEYYFTATPLLVRWVMNKTSEPTTVIYLDADLYFFDDPLLALKALGTGSIGIIEHRYPAALAKRLAKYGTYNVGWVGFRNDENGRACLDWWAARTLEWCSDVPSGGRYADQGYLNSFPALFVGVVVLESSGLNLAPWNTARFPLSEAHGAITVAVGQPLVFFHFHGLRKVGNRYVTSQLLYRSRLGSVLRKHVYVPYLRALESAEAEVRKSVVEPNAMSKRGNGWHGLLGRFYKTSVNRITVLTGNSISLTSLQ